MRFLVRATIQRVRLTVFLLLLTIVAAAGVFFSQARQEDPEITMRKAQVVVRFPGLSAEQVEQLLIKPVEDEIKTMPEVKSIESTALSGLAIILPELGDEYFDLEPIWSRLRNKMSDLEGRMPEGTQGIDVNDDFGRVAVVTLALTGDGFTPAELRWTARQLRDRFSALPLVAKVDLYGVQTERIWLEMDPELLNRLGLDPAAVVGELQRQNVIIPGGSVVATGMKIIIQPSGDFRSVEEIRNVSIPLPEEEGLVYLRDLLEVRRGYAEPPEAPALLNGAPAVVLGISMVKDSNITELDGQIQGLLPEVRADLPLGMTLTVVNYQPQLVAEAVAGATENLWQTVAVVLFVVMFFLGWRTGLIVGAGVPLTIMAVLVGMSLWGIAIHRISIAAIIVALGLLVDNGIVVAEDIQRRLAAGVDRRSAAEDSAASLALPLLISSLTTILAFMPLMLARNTSGEFLASLTQVVILALLASWLLAVTVIPALCYWFLKPPAAVSAGEARPTGAAYALYERCLRVLLGQRLLFLAFVVLAMAGSMVLMGQVKQRNMPPSERNQFTVYLSLPAGTDILETQASAQRLARFLSDGDANPEITGNVGYIASGGPRFFLALQPPDPLPHSAFFVVNVQDYAQLPAVMKRVEAHMAAQLPEARGRCETLFLGASPIGTVETRVTGPDIRTLQVIAEQVKDQYRAIEGITGLRSDWENPILSVRVQIDQDLAARAGLSSQSIARTLSSVLDGYTVTDYREGENVIPVIIRSDMERRSSLETLRGMEFYSEKSSTPIPLLQIARLEGVVEPSQIRRLDQRRTVTIAAKHPNMGAAELYTALTPGLAAIDLPPGYALGPAGEIADSSESQGELFRYAPHCLLAMLVLLLFQFDSFRNTALVMSTIPLIIVGSILGLYIFRAYFEFPALLGIFSLAGIIINNSIVMIDRIVQERKSGLGVDESAISAAIFRVRPILITTTTTVVGLIPLALFGGEFWYSMSIVIMCGLGIGTVLTLGFVPVVYSLLYRGTRARSVPEPGA
jgi:multidrug efflux pump subunit AcrB